MRDLWLKVKSTLCWWEPGVGGVDDQYFRPLVDGQIRKKEHTGHMSYGGSYTYAIYGCSDPLATTETDFIGFPSEKRATKWMMARLKKIESEFTEIIPRKLASIRRENNSIHLARIIKLVDFYTEIVLSRSGYMSMRSEMKSMQQRGDALLARWQSVNDSDFPPDYRRDIIEKILDALKTNEANIRRIDETAIYVRQQFQAVKEKISSLSKTTSCLLLEYETQEFLKGANRIDMDAVVQHIIASIQRDIMAIQENIGTTFSQLAVDTAVATSFLVGDLPPDYPVMETTVGHVLNNGGTNNGKGKRNGHEGAAGR